jgi:hypothetical protein
MRKIRPMVDEIEEGRWCPMEIVEDDDQRMLGDEGLEQMPSRSKEISGSPRLCA